MITAIPSIIRVASLTGLACVGLSSASASDFTRDIDAALSAQDFVTAINLLDTRLTEHPDDSAVRFKRAQVLGWAGNYAAARNEFDDLVGEHPDNVDYVLARAQIIAWQGQDAEALAEVAIARQLAPDYEAVWQLEFQLLLRQDDEVGKEALAAFRRDAGQRFPTALWLQVPDINTDIESNWTVLVGLNVEDLSNNLPGWNRQFLEIITNRSNGARYFFRATRDERFGNSDSGVGGGGDWKLDDNWFAGANLHVAPGADFQPDTEYGLHIGRRLPDGWVGGLQYRRRNYETATVDSYVVTTERYFGSFRAAYSLSLSQLQGSSNSLGHAITLNWYRNDRNSFGISLNSGEEAEAIGAGQVLITSVYGITLTGRHSLNDRIGLDWWLGTHEQGDFYRRQYAGMAVSIGL